MLLISRRHFPAGALGMIGSTRPKTNGTHGKLRVSTC